MAALRKMILIKKCIISKTRVAQEKSLDSDWGGIISPEDTLVYVMMMMMMTCVCARARAGVCEREFSH